MTIFALRRLFLFLMTFAVLPGIAASASPDVPFQDVTLLSTAPSGDPRNDLLRFRFYPAASASAGRFGSLAPAVILVPQTGASYSGSAELRRFGVYLAEQGLNVAIITLPYHGERKATGVNSAVRFFGGTPERNAQAFDQSGADVGRLVDWLHDEAPPTVDRSRIGIVGISLGAIVAHLAMGRDSRITVGVALLGSGDLADLYRSSLLVKIIRWKNPVPPIKSEDDFLPLLGADPLTYADRNRPRNVLMIQAARDLVIPPRDATRLWEALGKPPICWLDTNHFALSLVPERVMKTSLSWFEQSWIPGASPGKSHAQIFTRPRSKRG
jgi:dienelactone hydrolase